MTMKRVGLEFVALFFLALTTGVATVPWSVHGMNWSDTGQIFHFGNRILEGEFPYRDFAYQSGFLGLLWDAAWQRTFGATYGASLAARLVLNFISLLVVYGILRQFVSQLTAGLMVSAVAFLTPVYFNDVLYGGGNNVLSNVLAWSAAFALVRGSRDSATDDRSPKRTTWLILAGVLLAVAIAARQSNGLVCAGVVFGVLLFAALRSDEVPRIHLIMTAAGFALGTLGVAMFLVANEALAPAVQELFVDAGEKKDVSLFRSVASMLSGGANVRPELARLWELLFLPGLLATGVGVAVWRESIKPSRVALGVLIVPVLVLAGFVTAGGSPRVHSLANEFPRTLFTILLLTLCLFPAWTRRALGVPSWKAFAVFGVGMGLIWGRKLSFLGPFDAPQDVYLILTLLWIAMTTRLTNLQKRWLASAFLIVGIALFGTRFASGKLGTNDGTQADALTPLEHPMTGGILVTEEKAAVFEALRERIETGDSCFIYGSAAPLYTLLQCRNPTRLDVTFSDAFTAVQAREAVEILRRDPPQWIVEAVNLHSAGMNRRFDGSDNFYGPHSQNAPRILHEGLFEMRREYRLDFAARTVLPASVRPRDWEDWDSIVTLRLYRRRD